MDRRSFVKTAALVPLATGCASFSLASPVESKQENATAHGATSAPMHDRYELTLRRVLTGDSPAYTEEFLLADVRPTAERRFTEFSGDLSGRYIGALATASQVYGTKFPSLDGLVQKVIACQKPDGYFGRSFHYEKPTDDDLALLWGNGRLLVGLVEYYRVKPSTQVLAASRKLGDWLVRIGPLMLSKEIRDAFGAQHFASSYICWMQQTEGLAGLYVITKDERYRKLAEEIAAVIERRPSDHVHGYLTSLRGVMDLYSAAGDAQFLRQCESAWQEVAGSKDLLITGGVPEGWSPNGHRTEGCAEADWVRFNLSLWKATGNAKYIAMAERAVFNELAFNQYASGDFGHRVYTDTGLPAAGAVRAWWCCTLHGLRCFPDVSTSAFRSQRNRWYYDMPVDGRMKTEALSATAESSLATDGMVRIKITASNGGKGALLVRKPEWADAVDIQPPGGTAITPMENGYLGIERIWIAGDVVQVKYGMKLKANEGAERRVSYWFGPWLLGACAADNPAYFNEMTADNKLGRVVREAKPGGEMVAGPFAVPIAAREFRCIPAEFPDQPGTVTLRAIAEQAGQPTTSWELRFLADERG